MGSNILITCTDHVLNSEEKSGEEYYFASKFLANFKWSEYSSMTGEVTIEKRESAAKDRKIKATTTVSSYCTGPYGSSCSYNSKYFIFTKWNSYFVTHSWIYIFPLPPIMQRI